MRQSFLHILFLVFLFCSCSREYTPSPQQLKDVPVVLGEVSQDTAINLLLSNAKNITYPEYKSNGVFTDVVLLDSAENQLAILQKKENNRWTTEFQPKANRNYTLQFKYNDKKIRVETKIPRAFSAKIIEKRKLENDTLLINLSVEPSTKEIHSFYVIECFFRDKKGAFQLQFTNNDAFTDNVKYGELRDPFKRLFFKKSQNQNILLKVPTALHPIILEDEYIELRVKSVTPEYYEYLYQHDLQLQDHEPYLPNNSKAYLGILGGAYNISFKIK